MPKCKKCEDSLPPENDYIVCQGCNSRLHYQCAGVREVKWRTNNLDTKAAWRCVPCRESTEQDCDGNIASVEMSKETITFLGSMIRKIIKEETKEVVEKINDFQKSIEFYSDQIDDLLKKISTLTETNNALIKKQQYLENQNKELKEENQSIKIIIEEDRQYNRNHNLIIDGIPDMARENVMDIVIKLGESVNNKIVQSDVQAVHRLPSKNNRKPIIIQFTNRLVRDKFLENCKSRRPTTDNIYPDIQPGPVYVNEHMTPYYKNLMFEAKKKIVDGQKVYQYVWFKNSKLFARKTADSPCIRISSLKDI